MTEKKSCFVFPFYHPTYLLLQEFPSFQVSFLSQYFLANHYTLSTCHYAKLCDVIFNHLFHQCLFLASFTNWGIAMPLPNPQSPLFLSFPLSLYHWIPSHCLCLLHAQGPQTCHFNHFPVTRASSREKDWQAVTSLPSLMCLYHRSPILRHMVLCPGLPCNPLLCAWRTSKELLHCRYRWAWQALRNSAFPQNFLW